MPKSFTLHDLPVTEKPRERLQKFGAEALSLAELLAIILRTGIKGETVTLFAQKLLARFGSLKKISEASLEDLQDIKGLGFAKAAGLKACFEISRRMNFEEMPQAKQVLSPEAIFKLIKPLLINFQKEHFLVLSLDSRNKILGIDTISIGTLNANLVHPRETFEAAISRHASAVVIVHNHPSGEVEPSSGDIETTKRLKDAGEILGIEVLDHLIIGQKVFFSFKAKGMI